MTERRETGRTGNTPQRPSSPDTRKPANWDDGERIAKYLARAGVASRRDVERLIEDGRVSVNGKTLKTPAFKVTGRERIEVSGQRVDPPRAARLWRYHKPAGLVTTHSDPEGRATIFDHLSKSLPRLMTIGRLDLTTEGLLLLTNDGELARALELPSTGLERRYRARAHGRVDQRALASLADGITVDGVQYAPIIATLDRTTGTNSWFDVTLTEGKNREVRRALEAVGLQVNRLIRVAYGPLELGELASGHLDEIEPGKLNALFGQHIPDDLKPGRPERPSARTGGGVTRSGRKVRDTGRGLSSDDSLDEDFRRKRPGGQGRPARPGDRY